MIEIYPRYEVIFDPGNIDQGCDKIAGMMSDEGGIYQGGAGCRAV